jgi:hypothetical protein
VNTVMNLRVPKNAGKFLSSCTIGVFSRRARLHERVSEIASFQIHNYSRLMRARVGTSYMVKDESISFWVYETTLSVLRSL